jgi:single-stranded-DNA-specific exonuclease
MVHQFATRTKNHQQEFICACYHRSFTARSLLEERSLPRMVWIEPEPVPSDQELLHGDPLIHELLYRRGIRDRASADEFLRTKPTAAPDLSLLPNLDRAVERTIRAIHQGETIAVYGDYDADGVTSTALLVRALRAALGDSSRVVYRLPTREEGYGLNVSAVDALATAGATLLIAVDCGSTDHDHVAHARELGLDVIVFDHHLMNDEGPEGAIVVSAQLAESGVYRELAAVGVAYLFVAALAREGCKVDGDGDDHETSLLDLVALGTIADVSPLLKANRSLVRDGLAQINNMPRIGVAALCRKAGLSPTTLNSEQISFKVAPRLNAAGRMGDPRLALELLLTDDPLNAETLAAQLELLNSDRRSTSTRIIDEAEGAIRSIDGWSERPLLVIRGAGWSAGVLGAVANQLMNRFGRPIVVLTDDGTVSRGSARSVPGFDISAALSASSDLLLTYGGHSQAAGLSLQSENVSELETRLLHAVEDSGLRAASEQELLIDAELPAAQLSLETAQLVELLQPFGQGNRAPLFLVRDLPVRQYDSMGQDKTHLTLQLQTPKGIRRAVSWGAANRSRELTSRPPIDIVCLIGIDTWNGQTRLQVEIKDFRAAEERTSGAHQLG